MRGSPVPKPVINETSGLQVHARDELDRAGLFDEGSDYDGMLGHAAMDIVRVFSTQGHSGTSAAIVIDLVTKLMRYENLTPLTSASEEWIDQSEASGGSP